jgi:hypothetical protein
MYYIISGNLEIIMSNSKNREIGIENYTADNFLGINNFFLDQK